MPPYLQGSPFPNLPSDVTKKDLDYDYPGKLNIRPGSKAHEHIRTEVLKRANESAGVISRRHESWQEIDATLTTYVKPRKKGGTNSKQISAKSRLHNIKAREDSQKLEIVFPYSYTILETLMSYLVSTFIQDPMFKYEGVGSEDIIGATLMEKIIAIDCIKHKIGLSLHTLFRDALAYGVGFATPTWKEHHGKRRTKKPKFVMGIPLPGQFTTSVKDALLYEGNDLENIDPYLVLPDTNFSVHDIQAGEYFGWLKPTNLMDLLTEEKEDDNMFNVEYLRSISARGSSVFVDPSNRNQKSGVEPSREASVGNPVDELSMYIKIIPREWKLGKGRYPEKWLFTLCNDSIVTRAMPIGLDHNEFPVIAIAPDFDGYSISPVSKMEILSGMQSTLDWMFNSHIKNVRKAINDMFVVDPYLINVADVENPEEGKVIRTRKPSWGRGVKDSIMQFPVSDVTRGHVQDASFIMGYMDKAGGADSAAQGSLRQGGPERLTGAEFKGTQAGQFNRLNRLMQVVSMQGMQDIGYMFAMHTKQFLKQDTYVKLVGTLPQEFEKIKGKIVNGRMPVSPYDLLVNFDVVVRDASTASGNDTEVWIKLYEILSNSPELAAKFDMVRIFQHIAKSNGAKEIEQFEARQDTNQNVQAEVDAGNLIPTEQAIQENLI